MSSLSPGLHGDVAMHDYVTDKLCGRPSLSAGVMHDLIYRSPAHAWWNHPRLNPAWESDESSRADIGSAAHSAILGGVEIVYAPEEYEDWRTKAARELREQKRKEGKLLLLAKNRLQVEGMTKSARAALETLQIEVSESVRESTLVWESGGVLKRGRPDLWSEKTRKIIDVKTCESAAPGPWIKGTLTQGGYDIQCEHYLEGMRAVGGADESVEFLFLLVEMDPPFATSFVGLDPAFSDFARRKCALAADVWNRCLAEDKWPGYSPYPHWAELAPWQEADLELRMAYQKEVSA